MTLVYGWLPQTPSEKDFSFTSPAPFTGAFVDLAPGFAQVYDQLALGSCVSNGGAALVDFARKKQGLAPIGPSRLFLYFQGRVRGGYPLDQDTGLQVRDVLTVVSKDGAPPETDWPYDISRFTQKPPAPAYADGKTDLAVKFGQVQLGGIDATIEAGYPVVQGFPVHESFEADDVAKTGIVPMPKSGEQIVGGHCTVICSTPKDGSLIGGIPGVLYRKHLNSWSGYWGQGGYYWAPVAFTTAYSSDLWMLTDMSDPNGPVPPVPPVSTPDQTFAAVLHPWATQHHVGANHSVAVAAKAWLAAKNL